MSNALARIMESEVGCMIVAVLVIFAPVAALKAAAAAGLPIAGTEVDAGPR